MHVQIHLKIMERSVNLHKLLDNGVPLYNALIQ